MFADPGATARADSAPVAGHTVGQAQLAALRHAGLVADAAKEKSKKKNAKSGISSGSEHAEKSLL